jgi:hypothetical protein
MTADSRLDPCLEVSLSGIATLQVGVVTTWIDDDLVPRNQGQLGMRQFAINDMQVGSADAAGMNLQKDFARSWFAPDQLQPLQWLTCGSQDHRASDQIAFDFR